MQRPSGRQVDQLRPVRITRHFTCHAEGSVLVAFGNTQVICTATVEEGVPRFMRGEGHGWITAEYGMLPRSTGTRMGREAARGKQGGRTVEIQRLIGRSLRAAVDLAAAQAVTVVMMVVLVRLVEVVKIQTLLAWVQVTAVVWVKALAVLILVL